LKEERLPAVINLGEGSAQRRDRMPVTNQPFLRARQNGVGEIQEVPDKPLCQVVLP